jgi:hypothetical protein
VEIAFQNNSDHSKRGVLEALKQAFEDVKNDVADV